LIYLDTSAFVKLIWAEKESDALQDYLLENESTPLVGSTLLVVETRRAVLREDPPSMVRADLLLSRVGQIGIGPAVVESAGRLPEPTLRPLDAIHLATALMLQDELRAMVTYDDRLARAATAQRIPVVAPA
jgi:predicted nucleic acid-binding protein